MLYLLPAYLTPDSPTDFFAPVVREYIMRVDFYFVENEKTARRVIRFFAPEKALADLRLFLLDKHAENPELEEAKKLMVQGIDFGLLSEAGLPCIADPGNKIVRWAHERRIQVCPVSGPSSIILALISSGFNGQNFSFCGYLPIDKSLRRAFIKNMEKKILSTGYTQIFMETPYRNVRLLQDLFCFLSPDIRLCIAANIHHPKEELIKTLCIEDWKNNVPKINKVPAIFVLGV
ncbi:MAG: SAM-dependent methyltransferase [Bergeyella sp.]|nr:SAM-dependent methyltransferase [Bergeyella sp.]